MIQEGLLWLDNTPGRAIAEKVRRAAARYMQKHGRQPNVCYVHAGESEEQVIEGIKVLPTKSVLPHHFWLGVQ